MRSGKNSVEQLKIFKYKKSTKDPAWSTFDTENLDSQDFKIIERAIVSRIAKTASSGDCIKGRREIVDEISILLIYSRELSLKIS